MDTNAIQSNLFTRQQIAQVTGLDDSALNYWMREGLLRPAEGGTGKGSHRRFRFEQVNIAAVYGELRRFGVNISALRSLAELLQSAVDLGHTAKIDVSNYGTATYLATKLAAFRRGEEVLVEPNWMNRADMPEGLTSEAESEWFRFKRPATDEQDLIDNLLRAAPDDDDLASISAAAELIGPGRETQAKIYTDMVADILRPGYSDEATWLLGLRDDGTWDIESGRDGTFFDNIHGRKAGDFGSGIFVPVGAIWRKMWALKTPGALRRERQAEYTQEKLALAGIQATVSVVWDPSAADDEYSFNIQWDDEQVTWDQIQEVLNHRPWMKRKEDSK
jgi:DNA-binding transcriptional MerR regulator